MKWHRIYGLMLRHLYHIKRNIDFLVAPFYWPLIDLFIWGITSSYFQSQAPNTPNIIVSIVSAIVLWVFVSRSYFEVSVNITMELWDRNLINLFASPLMFGEWVIALILFGLVRVLMSFVSTVILAYVFYKVGVFSYGFYLIPFSLLLMGTGWWLAFFVSSFVVRYGSKVQIIVWSTIALISPLSAIYYPVSILPKFAQNMAAFVPTSYVFEGLREVINTGHLDPKKVYISAILTVIYIIASLLLFWWNFKKTLEKGLSQAY